MKRGVKKKKAATRTAKKATKKTASKTTRKKTAAKPKKKTTAKSRTTVKRKTVAAKKSTAKKSTAKKTTAKKTAKKTATKKSTAKKAAAPLPKVSSVPKIEKRQAPVIPMRETAAPLPSATAAAPAPTAAPAEQSIGVVTHYYSHLSVAVVQLNEGPLRVGDPIHIKGHTTDLRQSVESMEVDHQSVQEAAAGQIFGLKVRDHVREHDQIYRG